MKKILISVLIILLVALSVLIGLKGINIGNIKILGIKGIQDKNKELDQKVEEATRLASTDFKRSVGQVQESAKKLTEEKEKYEEMALLNTNEEGQIVTQIQKYEIATLWVKLGNYATSEGVTLKMELTNLKEASIASVENTSNDKEYNCDLKFTANGSYISITDFISDIENDTTLGFKIEEFKMTPSGGTENLQATFTCKEVTVKGIDSSVTTATSTDTSTSTDTTNTNTGNTTNTNTTNTNTTNATNTTTGNTTNTSSTSTNTNTAQ